MTRRWFTITALCSAIAANFALPSAAAAQTSLRSPSSEVSFHNGAVNLTGWLEMPAASAQKPVPVVILVGGNNTSWQSYDWMFRAMADSLLHAGIGVFYYDHRGDGKSQGSWAFSTYEELADDVGAAAQQISMMHGVDARRIGVWGHSMGGWIAPLAASRSHDLSYVITASGPGVTPLIQTAYDHMMQDITRGVARETAIEMDALRRDLWAYYTQPIARLQVKAQKTLEWSKTRPWFAEAAKWRELQGVGDSVPNLRYVLSPQFDTAIAELRRDAAYDPTSALQRLHVPMLALFGGADRVVPNDLSIAAIRTAFSVSGNDKLTVHVFPAANHSLMTGTTRDAAAFAPGYLHMLADWINNVPAAVGTKPEAAAKIYRTKVTLGTNTCTDVTIEDHPTTVELMGDSLRVSHAGLVYTGTMRAGRFTTSETNIEAGDVNYSISVRGSIEDSRLEADATVVKKKSDGASMCSYVVHWSGRR